MSKAAHHRRQRGQAYGVELFFSGRMGDEERADRILDMGWETDPVNLRTGSNTVFSKAYDTMHALDELIDNGRLMRRKRAS